MKKKKPSATTVKPVKLSRLKKIVTSLEKTFPNQDIDVTFEYLLASCFPTCWNNIQEDLAREHTLGYLQAKKELEEKVEKK